MSRLLACLLFLPAALLPFAAEAADTGWTITSFHADIRVMPDSSLDVVETIKVDFDSLTKHGIFRDVPFRYDYDHKHYRIYRIAVVQVSDGAGHEWPVQRSERSVSAA